VDNELLIWFLLKVEAKLNQDVGRRI